MFLHLWCDTNFWICIAIYVNYKKGKHKGMKHEQIKATPHNQLSLREKKIHQIKKYEQDSITDNSCDLYN